MILKGSQRSGGQDLAIHLMRSDDNEHVRLHELRGFASATLKGAFKEAEAISWGTRCRQYLFSLSLSPPAQERVQVAIFEDALDRIEACLGLAGQPRAIVFHEKEGRRHAHCVWSRIDAETMTARPLSFFKTKLMRIARDLYLEHGWTMPDGIARTGSRNPTNFSLAEWQQAKRQGIDPRWTKEAVQACWARSDNRASFAHSLEEQGFFLARGDRRGFVVLDTTGTIQALPRVLDLKTKEVRARLGDGDGLPSVEEAQATIARQMRPALQRHIEESRERFRTRSARLARRKVQMTALHRAARTRLDERQAGEWQAETAARAGRLPTGLRALWQRLTGRYRVAQAQNEAEAKATQARHAAERDSLIDHQLSEREVLQDAIKALRHEQAQQLRSLRSEVAGYLASGLGGDRDKPFDTARQSMPIDDINRASRRS